MATLTSGSAGDKPADQLVNQLAKSTSPYVRAHQNNPVAWQEWSSETIALAQRLNRLIFLSIGYSACHWCHVMERESFMSPEVAAILNESFIPIKVDRESRPDIDDIYMNYVTSITGSGGWPLNVFLTPDLDPIFGGTYWPGPHATSLPRRALQDSLTFLDILEKMRDVWQSQRQKTLQSAKDITSQLKHFAEEGTHLSNSPRSSDAEPLELDLLDEALSHFKKSYDKNNGGFSRAPKFPTPTNLDFLISLGGASLSTPFAYPKPIRSIVGEDSCSTALNMVVHTLIAMARGGIRDHLGYGFHRYSVTADWSLPHFEKMLYDNAQLLSTYSAAFAVTKDPEILGAVYSLVGYLNSPSSSIVSDVGGLYSSEDADSLPNRSTAKKYKREGAYYVFTHKELSAVLPDDRSVQVVARHYNIVPDGNVDYKNDPHDEFLGQNVISIAATPSTLAKELGLTEEDVVKTLKQGRKLLAEYRDRDRPRPDVDTKIVVAWNALAIKGLVDASVVLSEIDPDKAASALDSAKRIANFIKQELYDESSGVLTRIWSLMPDGTGKKDPNEAFLDDYAYLCQACLALYQSTFDEHWLQWAEALQSRLNTAFLSPDTQAYYSTPSSSPSTSLPLRLKPGTDNTLPSPNALISQNLLHLFSLLGSSPAPTTESHPSSSASPSTYQTLSTSTQNAFAVEIIQHPFLFPSLLSSIVTSQIGLRTITLFLPSSTTTSTSAVSIQHTLRARGVKRDGKTLVSVVRPGSWLQTRNPLFKDFDDGSSTSATGRERILVCEAAGRCWELKEGDRLADENDEVWI